METPSLAAPPISPSFRPKRVLFCLPPPRFTARALPRVSLFPPSRKAEAERETDPQRRFRSNVQFGTAQDSAGASRPSKPRFLSCALLPCSRKGLLFFSSSSLPRTDPCPRSYKLAPRTKIAMAFSSQSGKIPRSTVAGPSVATRDCVRLAALGANSRFRRLKMGRPTTKGGAPQVAYARRSPSALLKPKPPQKKTHPPFPLPLPFSPPLGRKLSRGLIKKKDRL